ncbi:hypothetical protein [Ciceribacter sp. L1K22]|uniref:hypothetical protein n=1 Tax=Ciceribacter sp. L1K22 TaxID=2820275 RepID=UPI001ABE8797|nr:hypothetical protein [Ciceribacter sp. L1K22]MBO3760343.1 hypothetical protein [Ciceribacter sp. L1K22]
MTLILCKLGVRETEVGGTTYKFDDDGHGRAVAEVQNLTHQACLLAVEHYTLPPEIVVEPEPEVEPERQNEPVSETEPTSEQEAETEAETITEAEPEVAAAPEPAPADEVVPTIPLKSSSKSGGRKDRQGG